MCAIVIAATKLKVTDVTGYNPLSVDAEDVSNEEMRVLEEVISNMKDEHSNGVDRMFLTDMHIQWCGSSHVCDTQQ
jgi:hypothetical protein